MKKTLVCFLILLHVMPATAQVGAKREPRERGLREVADFLSRDARAREMLSIRNTITLRVARAGVDLKALKNAYKEGDYLTVQRLLPFSDSEFGELDVRMTRLMASLNEDYPELKGFAARFSRCVECNLEQAFYSIGRHIEGIGESVRSGQGDLVVDGDGSGCRWLQYTLALAGCATLGPIGYWPCAYVVYCNLCWGDLHDAICY